MRDSEPTDDVFPNKLENALVFDVGISFCLYPFSEVVDGYKQEFFLSINDGQGVNYVHSSLREWPRACDQIEGFRGHARNGSIHTALLYRLST